MIRKVTYRNVDHNTVDIFVEDEHGIHDVGQAFRGPGAKWKLKAFFHVDMADLERLNKLYDGPVEGGRELIKAWEYYRSYELRDTGEYFLGDFFK